VTGKVRDGGLDLALAREAARSHRAAALVDVFGSAGRGARSADGMADLPFDVAVQIEAVVHLAT
jgi:hypothetical protein